MIDLHCHILPGLDDGARSVEEGLSMAKTALQDGIHTIVATPHSLDGLYLNPLMVVTGAVESLQSELDEQGLHLRLCVGGDVHLCPAMVERVLKAEAVSINNLRRYLLLELPPQILPDKLLEEIFSLKIHGITPIITHPERHPAIQRDLQLLREMISFGALAQVTAMSVTGEFGGLVTACAEAMLEQRLAHVIASDAHSADNRPPVLSRAVELAEEILDSAEEAKRMVEDLPAAILAGQPLDVPTPAQNKKSLAF